MIPKIIHYAWFGSSIPPFVQKRVQSWKEILPDWEFKQWNEDNYDLSKFSFSSKMYSENNLGFVADELRYDVLYEYGGFYLDTDMIIKKNLEPLLNNKVVFGFLYDNSIATGMIGSVPKSVILRDILNVYDGKLFPEITKQLFSMTSNPIVTKILMKEFPNFKTDGSSQILQDGMVIFPKDFFSYPSRNQNANFAEHLFDNTWGTNNQGIYKNGKVFIRKHFPYFFATISAHRGVKSAERDGVPYTGGKHF